MISAEVEGSGIRVCEVGCRPLVDDEGAGVGVKGQSVADSLRGPTLLAELFFLVMPSEKEDYSNNNWDPSRCIVSIVFCATKRSWHNISMSVPSVRAGRNPLEPEKLINRRDPKKPCHSWY